MGGHWTGLIGHLVAFKCVLIGDELCIYLAESESTVQSVVGDRDEGFGGADENRSLLLERKLSAVQQQKKHQSSS